GLELYKSAIPERLGGRFSSIMDVSTKDGNAKKVTGTLGIGPLTSKFTLEGPLGSEKTTFLAGGRATYSNWFLKYLPDVTFKKSKVSFADLMINLTHAFSEKDKLYVSGYISSDAFRLNQDSTYAYENKNARIKWKHNFTDKFYNVLSVGIDQYDYSVDGSNNPKDGFLLKFGVQQLSGKTDFKFIPTNKHEINFGLQHIVYHLDPGSLTPSNPASLTKATFVEKESGTETSIYFGDQYRVNNKIQLQGGLRYSYYRFAGPKKSYLYSPGIPRSESAVIDSVQFKNGETIQTYHGPELRASARYLISPRTSLKISYNSLRQYIHMITNTTALSPTDIWKLSDQFIKPQVGHQLSLGFYTQPGNKGDEFSVEAYYKLTSTYSTGRPITYPIGVFNMGGAQRVLYSERNAFRIPDFFRTDFSVILENNHKVTQKVHGSWTFGVYNIMGRSNPYSVYFIVNNREVKGYQMSVFANPIPFLTFNLKFN
ncbi:MAG: TonB-dependent receptor, partial [Chitinophagaceae bacterium]|nr:TonB-dependent receptor [Chitinophagaceae bacterium]